MKIELNNIKPRYMSEAEISASDIYLQNKVVFEKGKKFSQELIVRAKAKSRNY